MKKISRNTQIRENLLKLRKIPISGELFNVYSSSALVEGSIVFLPAFDEDLIYQVVNRTDYR